MNIAQLKEIVADQKEVVDKEIKDQKIIKREFREPCKYLSETDLIKVITGVRRCGKSIFAHQLFQNKPYAYINFDDERLSKIKTDELNDVLKAFYELYGEVENIVLDEIQNVPGWELFANRLKRMGKNLVVTGSNASLLSKKLATHLTGRHISIELFPFSFREYLAYEGINFSKDDFYSTKKVSEINHNLNKYLELGGFPEILKYKNAKEQYLSALFSTILTKDVIIRYNIKYKADIKEIAFYLLSNISDTTTFSAMKNISEFKSTHTAKNYISYLEDAYLFITTSKFSYKKKEIERSPKKVYVIDTGLANVLGFKFTEKYGKIIENAVAIELCRRKSINPRIEIYYWKDYHQREVDFILKEGIEIKELIQVCYDIRRYETKKREINALLIASQELRCNKLLIITWDFEGEEETGGKKVSYIPLWKWLLKI